MLKSLCEEKIIVFDFDGTLIDSDIFKEEFFFSVSKVFNVNRDIVAKSIADGGDRFAIFKRIAKFSNPPLNFMQMVNAYSIELARALPDFPKAPGIPEILECLKNKKIKLYINSATPKIYLKETISALKWDVNFDDILGLPRSKIQNLKLIMNQNSAQSRDILVIGNGTDDATSADTTGCRFIWADPFNRATEPPPKNSNRTIRSFFGECV